MIRRTLSRTGSANGIIHFISDPELLGPHFQGPSWDRWRAVLRAAYALPMSRRDLELFHEVSGGRTPPTRRVKELVACIGRGGGKDSIAAALAIYIAVTADFSKLRPGELGTIMTLAVDRDQAGIAFSYVRANIEETPMLARLIRGKVESDRITLSNRAEILVQSNNMRSPRGRTIAATIFDEAAHWRSEATFANPADEVDAAISPGLMRFPGSMKIIISSVHRRQGLLYDRFAKSFGKDDDNTLVVLGTSLQFNPTLDESEINRQLALDPERAAAEYLSQWRDDLTNFLDRQLVEAAVEKNVIIRAPQSDRVYKAFADPSGGRRDAFTAAVGHVEDKLLIIDAVYEKRSPFDANQAMDEVAEFVLNYSCVHLFGDAYGADLIVGGFRERGVNYEHLRMDGSATAAKLSRSELYLNSLPLFTSGRVRLPDNPRLVHQLINLERRAARSGHDTVDHPPNGSDDLANAVCGCLVALADDPSAAWRKPWNMPSLSGLLGYGNSAVLRSQHPDERYNVHHFRR